ncbi:MAG: bifunctional 5,10-methylenetetrahydrofolate dehydrogenase/5,10-methenyltetrahydrofolate cyclohydrolase [Candidatus Pacebacteria bacterium]|nr:bifunctional 5,10-methylenetetrahydrofolate dehydrogenase/5,10-methenyltetrahydrofolate cyclohydrolase [Candidatus Paceibacterota bacterium]
MKIDGKKIAEEIKEKIKNSFDFVREAKRPHILAVVYAGENQASETFIKIKEKTAKELKIDFRVYKFSENISSKKLREEVVKIGKQELVKGLIVQLPLPEKINRQKILNAIPEKKDLDCLSEKNWGKLVLKKEGVLPPAVEAVKEILKIKEIDFSLQGNNMRVAVVGAGFLVGKPVAVWMMGKVGELAVFDEGSDLNELKKYDLVVTGVGKAGIIKTEFLKEGAGVIDFGYDGGKGDLDVNNEKELEKLSFYTPTPGGTGPILVAKLFENFFKSV